MQHIGLRQESETGEILRTYPSAGIDVGLIERVPNNSACLRFIDPYGDTIFNQLQLPVLISELKTLLNADKRIYRENIQELVKFLETCIEHHTYVRFIGD